MTQVPTFLSEAGWEALAVSPAQVWWHPDLWLEKDHR